MDDAGHIPVLLEPVLAVLEPAAGQTCLDCTLGRGGHAAALIPRLAPGGRYIGLDMDPGNCAYATRRLAPIAAEAGVELITRAVNFSAAASVVREVGAARGGGGGPVAGGPGVRVESDG